MGRKIGFTNRTLWQRYGVHEPMWGMVYDRTLIHAHDNAATVALDGLVQPRIEPEICVQAEASAARRTTSLDCIEWMAHAVEIVQCHHPDWKVTIADCTADNGLHGRLIVGTPVPLRTPTSCRLVEARPSARAISLVDKGVGANVLGSPLLSLALSRRDCCRSSRTRRRSRRARSSRTGMLTDAHPVAPGETLAHRGHRLRAARSRDRVHMKAARRHHRGRRSSRSSPGRSPRASSPSSARA